MATVLPHKAKGPDIMNGPVDCATQPTRFTRLDQRASGQFDFHPVRFRKRIPVLGVGKPQLQSCPDEKSRLLSLPLVDRRSSPARAKRLFTTKISDRICSAPESNPRLIDRDRYRCARTSPEAVQGADDSMSRHFCELMGPDLCNDCSKQWIQLTSLDEYQQLPSSPEVGGSNPFRDLISRGSVNTVGSQNQEQKRQLTAASLNRSMDKRLDSRLSYIQSLARSSTVRSALLDSLLSESERERKDFMHARRQRSAEVYSKEASPSPQRPRSTGSTSPLTNRYLAELCSREGPFRNNVALLYYPNKRKYAWRELPVEPVTMELKFINFTIYDAELKRV